MAQNEVDADLGDGKRIAIRPIDDDDDLVNELIEENEEFRTLLARSAASDSIPFRPGS